LPNDKSLSLGLSIELYPSNFVISSNANSFSFSLAIVPLNVLAANANRAVFNGRRSDKLGNGIVDVVVVVVVVVVDDDDDKLSISGDIDDSNVESK